MVNEAYSRHHASGTVHFFMTVTLLIILSRATLTSTLASCNADPSLSLTDRTQSAENVLAGTVVRSEDDHTLIFKVFQVLKGDEKLRKKKIKIVISDVTEATTSRHPSLVAPPTPPSTRAYPVAIPTPTPLSRRCLSGAVPDKRYIVFVQRFGVNWRTFELVFDGVLQSKRTVKEIKMAIEEETTTTRVTTPIHVSSTALEQTTEDNEFTTSDNQQSTNAEDTQGDVGNTNTDYLPKTSDSHLEPCPANYDGYCLHNGVCHWVLGINQPSCECVDGYRGNRCMYRELETSSKERLFGDYWEVFIIGTIFGIVILLTLIGAIVYVVRKKKATQTRRQVREEAADAFIQNNFQPGDDVEQQQQQADDNQNKTTDRYIKLPTNETYPIVETAIDSEALQTTTFGNSHSSSRNSFRLQDPPFRKGSSHSTASASKESTV